MIRSISLFMFLLTLILNPTFALALPEKDTGNLGEIRQSILTPEAFQGIYGEGWVLMKGQTGAEIQDSDIVREGLWTAPSLPDARGVFLRSTNQGRSTAEGNPDGDADVCGAYLADQFKSHNHQDKGHGHSCQVNLGTCDRTGRNASAAQGNGGGWKNSTLTGSTSTGYADIQNTGGSETRPRCVVVNTFIKINRTSVINQQNQALARAFEALPKQVLGNEGLRGIIREMVREETQRLNAMGSTPRTAR